MENSIFLTVTDIMALLGVKESKAYAIIKTLNGELNDHGYMTVAGKVNRAYFEQRFLYHGSAK